MFAQQSLQPKLSRRPRRYVSVPYALQNDTVFSDAHRTESVSVMDHEQTMGVSSRVLDQKQQNIFGRISLFWNVELQGHIGLLLLHICRGVMARPLQPP